MFYPLSGLWEKNKNKTPEELELALLAKMWIIWGWFWTSLNKAGQFDLYFLSCARLMSCMHVKKFRRNAFDIWQRTHPCVLDTCSLATAFFLLATERQEQRFSSEKKVKTWKVITVSSSVSRFFSLDDEKNISSTANIGFIGQLFVGKMAALDLYSTGNVGTLT